LCELVPGWLLASPGGGRLRGRGRLCGRGRLRGLLRRLVCNRRGEDREHQAEWLHEEANL
jgi:hypothetical protein